MPFIVFSPVLTFFLLLYFIPTMYTDTIRLLISALASICLFAFLFSLYLYRCILKQAERIEGLEERLEALGSTKEDIDS